MPRNLIISEYSEDGKQWKLSHHINMEMGEQPVLGLAISNLDNQLLAHAQVSQVDLKPAPPAAIRTIKPGYFKPRESHTVELEIYNPQKTSQDI